MSRSIPRGSGKAGLPRLYEALERNGIDVEAGSGASLAHGTMTLDGYLFMRARRLRKNPDAEAMIVAAANICPACGPLDGLGNPLNQTRRP